MRERIPHPIRRIRRVVTYLLAIEARADREWRATEAAALRDAEVTVFEGIEVAEAYDPYMQSMVRDHQHRMLHFGAKG